MSFVDPSLQLGPTDLLAYANNRRTATSQYGQGQAQLQYQRALGQQNYGNSQYDLGRQYDQQREQLPGGFAHRGLLNSGIYGAALQNYGTNRVNAFNRLGQGYASQQGQYDAQGRNLEQNYQDALANIASQEQAQRDSIAAQLKGLL